MFSKISAGVLFPALMFTASLDAQPADPSMGKTRIKMPTVETSRSLSSKRIELPGHKGFRELSLEGFHQAHSELAKAVGKYHEAKDRYTDAIETWKIKHGRNRMEPSGDRVVDPTVIPQDFREKILETEGLEVVIPTPRKAAVTFDPLQMDGYIRIRETEALLDQQSSKTREYLKKVEQIENTQQENLE